MPVILGGTCPRNTLSLSNLKGESLNPLRALSTAGSTVVNKRSLTYLKNYQWIDEFITIDVLVDVGPQLLHDVVHPFCPLLVREEYPGRQIITVHPTMNINIENNRKYQGVYSLGNTNIENNINRKSVIGFKKTRGLKRQNTTSCITFKIESHGSWIFSLKSLDTI